MSKDDDQWPLWVGLLLMGVLLGGGLAGLVLGVATVRSWDDFLSFVGPTAGPLGAALAASVVVLVARLWLTWRTRSWTRRAAARLRRLVAAVADERAQPPEQRATGADDESLDRVAGHLGLALRRVEGGGAVLPAAEPMELARRTAQDRWAPRARLTREVTSLHSLARSAGRVQRGVEREVDRDDRRDPRAGY